MQFSLVIPVHNEDKNIKPLLEEIRRGISEEHQYEVVCVNDYSSDNTAQVLEQQLRSQANLKVVTFQKQHGQSSTLRVGVQNASYSLIVTLDGDDQNDPTDMAAKSMFTQIGEEVFVVKKPFDDRRKNSEIN